MMTKKHDLYESAHKWVKGTAGEQKNKRRMYKTKKGTLAPKQRERDTHRFLNPSESCLIGAV